MSNLQEISLAGPECLPVTETNVTPPPKSNSLKRFFKISKKPLVRDQVDNDSVSSSEDNKELGKSRTISRFFTRLKKTNKVSVDQEQSSSIAEPEVREKPPPNPKLRVKSSISSYWKLLFQRQKAQRQIAEFGLENSPENMVEEVHELQPVNHESETEIRPTENVEETEIDVKADSEPPQPMAKRNVANKASAQEMLSALEGGQLPTVEDEEEETIQPVPTFVNEFI
ncbi:uncharacterized protein LOC108101030 [Drosophila ficusphila]|uniref:uncharacterized protein LOC108101030 n=1 Tax=Drosophila ficusphila TaxID=30025 RepID=UPI0007E880FD|nr:uncharacterized protein LOC108101030 [Drosophila ficusphila]